MIGLRQSSRFLQRSMQTQSQYGSLLKTSQRGFAGGAEKPALSADTTDYDVLFVGKFNSLNRNDCPWMDMVLDLY